MNKDFQEKKLEYPPKPKSDFNLRNTNKKVTICTNFVKIRINEQTKKVKIYSIEILPSLEVDSIHLKPIFSQIRSKMLTDFNVFYISGLNLFTTNCSNSIYKYTAIIKVPVQSEHISPNSSSDNNNSKEVKENSCSKESSNCYESKDSSDTKSIKYNETKYEITFKPTNTYINILNFEDYNNKLLAKCFAEKLTKSILGSNPNLLKFRDSFFDRNACISLNLRDEVFKNSYMVQGFSTSVALVEDGVFLKINNKLKFMNGKDCLSIIDDINYKSKHDPLNFKLDIEATFINKVVVANYGNYRTYVVVDIMYNMNPEIETITKDNGKGEKIKMNLVEYFKKQYNKNITKNQFLFRVENVGRKKTKHVNINQYDYKPILLPPQLCILTGVMESLRDNIHLKQESIKLSKMNADKKLKTILSIKDMFTSNQSYKKTNSMSPNDISNNWGFELGNIKKVEGRYLEKPIIKYKDFDAEIFKGKFRHKKMLNSVVFSNTNTVIFCSNYNYKHAEEAKSKIISCVNNIGIKIDNINKMQINIIDKKNEREDERLWIKRLSDINLKNYFVFLLFDNRSKRYYPSIKDFLKKEGIKNQALSIDSVNKPLTVMSNIMVQAMEKNGGMVNYIPFGIEKVDNSVSCLVGIEVNKNSVSVCMTYNKQYNKYVSDHYIPDPNNCRYDVHNIIAELFKNCIKKFYQINENIKVRYVFIYRSGSNEHGIAKIKELEAPLLDTLFNELLPECRFMYTVVIKRCDVKLIEEKRNDNYNNNNSSNLEYPGEGLVIDSGITKENSYEFFLQPVNGTGMPSFFKVVHQFGLSQMPIEVLQNITYKCCYSFSSWTGAIKVPSCLKHAEKNLANNTLTKSIYINDSLKSSPYYL